METVPPLPPISLSQQALDKGLVAPPLSSPPKKRTSILRRASTRVRATLFSPGHNPSHVHCQDDKARQAEQPSASPFKRCSLLLGSTGTRRTLLRGRASRTTGTTTTTAASSAAATPIEPDASKMSILDTLAERASISSLRPPGPSLGRTVCRSSLSSTSNALPIPPPLRCNSSSGTSTLSPYRMVSPTLTQWAGLDMAEEEESDPSTITLPMPSTPPAHIDWAHKPLTAYPLALSSHSKPTSLSPQTSVGSLPKVASAARTTSDRDEGGKMRLALRIDTHHLQDVPLPWSQAEAVRAEDMHHRLELHRRPKDSGHSGRVDHLYALPLFLAKRSLTAQDTPRSPAEETDLPPLQSQRMDESASIYSHDGSQAWAQAVSRPSSCSRSRSPSPERHAGAQPAGEDDDDEEQVSLPTEASEMYPALERPWSAASGRHDSHVEACSYARIRRTSHLWSGSRFSAFDGNPVGPEDDGAGQVPPSESLEDTSEDEDLDRGCAPGESRDLLPPPDLMVQAGIAEEDQLAIAAAREEALHKLLGQATVDEHQPPDWAALAPLYSPTLPASSPRPTGVPATGREYDDPVATRCGSATARARPELTRLRVSPGAPTATMPEGASLLLSSPAVASPRSDLAAPSGSGPGSGSGAGSVPAPLRRKANWTGTADAPRCLPPSPVFTALPLPAGPPPGSGKGRGEDQIHRWLKQVDSAAY